MAYLVAKLCTLFCNLCFFEFISETIYEILYCQKFRGSYPQLLGVVLLKGKYYVFLENCTMT